MTARTDRDWRIFTSLPTGARVLVTPAETKAPRATRPPPRRPRHRSGTRLAPPPPPPEQSGDSAVRAAYASCVPPSAASFGMRQFITLPGFSSREARDPGSDFEELLPSLAHFADAAPALHMGLAGDKNRRGCRIAIDDPRCRERPT